MIIQDNDPTMGPRLWREWADSILEQHADESIGLPDYSTTFFGGPWGTQSGSVEERVLYAYFIAEFKDTDPYNLGYDV